MDKNEKIYVAGHSGLVGSAIVERLKQEGFKRVICRGSRELDLTRQADVEQFFEKEKPDYVFLAAAKVGGIMSNDSYPADFIYRNLAIQNHVIHSSYINQVKKLLFLGSSCIYPKLCPQPMRERDLLSGYLEPTNEPYAIAKICGVKMCQSYNKQYGTSFISVMPTNLYGPNDNFDLETSHVLPAMIRKFHEAVVSGRKKVTIWGSGKPRREFMHVADLADACFFLMNNYDGDNIVNIGTGKDITIRELAEMVSGLTGFEGEILFDGSKPDGTPRKLLDISFLKKIGWEASIDLRSGVADTYKWYLRNLLPFSS